MIEQKYFAIHSWKDVAAHCYLCTLAGCVCRCTTVISFPQFLQKTNWKRLNIKIEIEILGLSFTRSLRCLCELKLLLLLATREYWWIKEFVRLLI